MSDLSELRAQLIVGEQEEELLYERRGQAQKAYTEADKLAGAAAKRNRHLRDTIEQLEKAQGVTA